MLFNVGRGEIAGSSAWLGAFLPFGEAKQDLRKIGGRVGDE